MGKKRSTYHRHCYLLRWVIVFIMALIGNIALNLAIATIQYPQPQAILTLGGSPNREIVAANLASENPELIVWVSSGTDSHVANQIFSDVGIKQDRYFLDDRATDTVTNFTTLVKNFRKFQIKHLYLVTSEFHMPRAKAIATIILGSQGIVFTPIVVANTRYDNPEPKVKIIRDIGRSILWLFSGYTGANLKDIN